MFATADYQSKIKSSFWNILVPSPPYFLFLFFKKDYLDGNKRYEKIAEFPLPCLIPGRNSCQNSSSFFAKVPGTVRPNPCIGRCPWRRRASPSTPQLWIKGGAVVAGGWWMKCSWTVAVAGVSDFFWGYHGISVKIGILIYIVYTCLHYQW